MWRKNSQDPMASAYCYSSVSANNYSNVKLGVEGGMPFDLMSDSTRAGKLRRTASEHASAGEDKENEPKTGDFDDDGVD